MLVARIGRLDHQRRRFRLQEDRRNFRQRNVVIVRAFVIAPADMKPHALGRDVAHRVVQHLDMLRRALQEFLLAQVLKAGVMRHGEIGAIELQREARVIDRLVFRLHRRGDGFDIGLMRRIEIVRLERGDETGRRRGHEHLARARCIGGVAQIGDVLFHRRAVAQRDRTGAGRAAQGLRPGHARHRGVELGIAHGIERRLARRVAGEAGQAIGDIGRIAGLRHLAVIDDVDAGLDLAADDIPTAARTARRAPPRRKPVPDPWRPAARPAASAAAGCRYEWSGCDRCASSARPPRS